MPAASEPSPVRLPHTFRPVGVRIAVYVLGALIFGTAAVIWFAFPDATREQFTTFQRLTVLGFGVAAAAGGHAMARSRVVATEERVTVVNGYKARRYHWNQVLAVSLPRGAPWAELDLSDGTSSAAMGIQGSDGARATVQVKQLRALIAQQSRTERDN